MAAPDVVAVETEGIVESGAGAGPTLLQIEPFRPQSDHGSHWEQVDLDVPPRCLSRVDAAGEALVVANLDGSLVAYLDRCPACFAAAAETALSEGLLSGDVLSCPAGHAYDVRLAGRALDHESGPLTPVPLLPDHGAWKVAIPRGAVA
jgi:nitrite reductase/ring-hydroxylating ferredoxin subunit